MTEGPQRRSYVWRQGVDPVLVRVVQQQNDAQAPSDDVDAAGDAPAPPLPLPPDQCRYSFNYRYEQHCRGPLQRFYARAPVLGCVVSVAASTPDDDARAGDYVVVRLVKDRLKTVKAFEAARVVGLFGKPARGRVRVDLAQTITCAVFVDAAGVPYTEENARTTPRRTGRAEWVFQGDEVRADVAAKARRSAYKVIVGDR